MPKANGVQVANGSGECAAAPSMNMYPTGFWEIGAWRANVQRIRDGAEMLDELAKSVKERIDIENKYARSLEVWSKKWRLYSANNLPEGCTRRAMEAVFLEGGERSRLHAAMRDRFTDELIKTIELFTKENYHRSAIRGFREAKEAEDEFEKAQRHWKKLSERLETSKRHYHHSCRTERSTQIQWMNSHSDASVNSDSANKARDRYERAVAESRKAKVVYEQQLRDLCHYNSVYAENMCFVFEKCQQMELKRMKFVVEMVGGMQKILVDLVQPSRLAKVHDSIEHTLASIDESEMNGDLSRWSLLHDPKRRELRNRGIHQMALFRGVCPGEHKKPQTSRYYGYIKSTHLQEFRPITNGSSKSNGGRRDSGGVVLTKKMAFYEGENHSLIASNLQQRRRSSIHVDSDLRILSNGEGLYGALTAASSDNNIQQTSVATPPPPTVGLRSAMKRQHHRERAKDRNGALAESVPPNRDSGEDTLQGQLKVKPPPYESLPRKSHKHHHSTGDAGKGSRGAHRPDESIPPAGGEEVDAKTNSEQRTRKERNGEPGIVAPLETRPRCERAIALYDYTPMEDDEIALLKGELLTVLSGPDHLGWCYGRKLQSGGEGPMEGLFPGGYIESA